MKNPAIERRFAWTIDERSTNQRLLQSVQVRICGNRPQLCLCLPAAPSFFGQQHLWLVVVVADEISECQILTRLAGERVETFGYLDGKAPQVLSDIPGHIPSTAGQAGWSSQQADVGNRVPPPCRWQNGAWGEGLEFAVCAEPAVRLTDKIEDREAVFLRGMTQTASELLEKNGQALGRAQKEDRIDFGHIHAFAELVDREQERKRASFQFSQQVGTIVSIQTGDESCRRQPAQAELVGHELRMPDRHTESDSFEGMQFGFVTVQGGNDSFNTLLGTGPIQDVDILEGRFIVTAIAPKLVAIDGNGIGNAEIMERAEKFFFQCLGKADFCSKAIAEIRRHVTAVHALRGCRKAEQNLWVEVVEYWPVAVGYAVVGFVYDDIVVKRRADVFPQLPR